MNRLNRLRVPVDTAVAVTVQGTANKRRIDKQEISRVNEKLQHTTASKEWNQQNNKLSSKLRFFPSRKAF